MDIDTYESVVECVRKEITDFDLALSAVKKTFPEENQNTLRSIVSAEYQKHIKANFRTSHSSENRRKIVNKFWKEFKARHPIGILVRLAIEEKTSPALVSKIVLEDYLKDPQVRNGARHLSRAEEQQLKTKVSQLIRNTHLIDHRWLALEIFAATVKDHSYGPFAEAIKHSVGEEHEQKIKDNLKALNIPFSDEHVLRFRGYDKTPDIKLEIPIAVGGRVINWIESKALFGDRECHEEYLKDQFWSYWNRFGPGLVIYWFGYLKELDKNGEAGILLADSFPTDITYYDPNNLPLRARQVAADTSAVAELSDSTTRLSLAAA